MLILLVTQEPPLSLDSVATGNAIRTAQLADALRNGGYATSQIWLKQTKGLHPDSFTNRDQLRSHIIRLQPDVILVSYWELLELLPFELCQPVILDFVAPRPLEELYQRPDLVGADLQCLQKNLSKCDLLLTGNGSQSDLLRFTLLEAGFDLRNHEPLRVVPLAAETVGRPESDPRIDGWTLVGGGVNWPWRESEEYWSAINGMQKSAGYESPRLVLFGGEYRWQETGPQSNLETDPIPAGYQTEQLAPYSQFSCFLRESAHIGIELSQENIERKYSQSFRSLEFLRHGLPLICNDYLPLAKLVKQYNAGWTVNNPEEIPALLHQIMADPDDWRVRSENALALVQKELNPAVVAEPLLDFLRKPSKAARLPVSNTPKAPAVLGKPAMKERLKRQLCLLKRACLTRLFQSGMSSQPRENILIVTRRDLFPANHGAAVKIIETARGLSQLGPKVGIISDDRNHWWLFENGREQRCQLPIWIRFLSWPHWFARLLHFSKDIPRSNSFLYLPLTDNGFFWNTLYVGNQLRARILQAEFPAYAKPCIDAREILHAAVVLVEHNIEYNRLKAQVTELTEPQFLNLRAIEVDLCNRSDAVVCVSDNDRQQLLNDGVKPNLLNTIPHGFNPEPFKLPARESLRQEFSIPEDAILLAFHGTFEYPPNLDALRVFAQILLPQLADSQFSFHVIAIGRNPPGADLHPDIHFTGAVDEVGPWLKACDLAVIPLREGGGTRMKIIDCFAAGLPVVSTSKGIEGIPVVDGCEAVIRDDWASMSNSILELSASKQSRDQISVAARDFAKEMDWKNICKRYLNVFSVLRPTP